jgi:ABC-2 type transport system permease protein
VRATSIIFRREMATYMRSPVGYVVTAIVLLAAGILFQSQALGGRDKLSADVLRMFFWVMSGLSMIAGIALSIRLVAEERQQSTIVLLNTSPIRDVEIILGKYLAALVFLAFMLLLSVYMPLLILVNGKISTSQLIVGYLGLLLLGGSSLAIGIFASSISRHQLVAAVVAVAINGIMVLLFPLAKTLDAPLKSVFENLDLWHVHFQGGFMVGVFNLKDLVFYLAVIYFFLLLATKTMELKRWQ